MNPRDPPKFSIHLRTDASEQIWTVLGSGKKPKGVSLIVDALMLGVTCRRSDCAKNKRPCRIHLNNPILLRSSSQEM
jgi:hypothetical protein